MTELFKFLWRWVKSLQLKHSNVRISIFARFNKKSFFEGNNVIHKRAVVGNSYIGRNTYIGENTNLSNSRIGRFCSISSDVQVVCFTHPSSIFVSSCPSFFSVLGQNGQTFVDENKFEEILSINGYSTIIGNDVWIGTKVIIKGGVKIGNGAIIAMGSVVTKDVPPYAIVAGVPAKVIKYRFTNDQIANLQRIAWWNQSDEWLYTHIDDFNNINSFMERNKV